MAGEQLFEPGTLGTLAVASGAVVVATNTIRRVTGYDKPIVAFAFAVLISFATAASAAKLEGWMGWLLAFLNACLLFCTATGAQETIVEGMKPKRVDGPEKQSGEKPKFWSSWLK